jgi:hypothetical protein
LFEIFLVEPDPRVMKIIIKLATAWLFILGLLVWKQYDYKSTPGKASLFVGRAPDSSSIKFDSKHYNFITFIHPKCSCSEATIENLTTMTRDFANKNISFHVVFYSSSELGSDLENSKYVKEVKELQNTRIYFDKKLTDFSLYDVETSGQSFLFDTEKNLIFKGGITESRGHLGETLSMRKIAGYLEGEKPNSITLAPTFGCGTEAQSEFKR